MKLKNIYTSISIFAFSQFHTKVKIRNGKLENKKMTDL
jgi:hypothetical protein